MSTLILRESRTRDLIPVGNTYSSDSWNGLQDAKTAFRSNGQVLFTQSGRRGAINEPYLGLVGRYRDVELVAVIMLRIPPYADFLAVNFSCDLYPYMYVGTTYAMPEIFIELGDNFRQIYYSNTEGSLVELLNVRLNEAERPTNNNDILLLMRIRINFATEPIEGIVSRPAQVGLNYIEVSSYKSELCP